MKMISPNYLQEDARAITLGGREPSSSEDWALCVNFWAANIAVGEVEACAVLALIFECPLSPAVVREIAAFQVGKK